MEKPATSPKITEAEWPIMNILWSKQTATAAEIVAQITSKQDKSMRTIKTLIRRLIQKGAVGFTVDAKDSRVYHYYPLIAQQKAQDEKKQTLLNVVFENDSAKLLAQFIGSSRLSNREIEKLEALLQQKKDESREQ